MSNETKRETNYSMNNKWNNNTRNMHITWTWTQSAHSCTPVHLVSHLIGSISESYHFISIVIHERTSLSRFSTSTSTCPSLSSSVPSTSCTASCTLSSTTWSPWKACASPPRGVTTPTTSTPPSQNQPHHHFLSKFGSLTISHVPPCTVRHLQVHRKPSSVSCPHDPASSNCTVTLQFYLNTLYQTNPFYIQHPWSQKSSIAYLFGSRDGHFLRASDGFTRQDFILPLTSILPIFR